jgi:hypothetical protein
MIRSFESKTPRSDVLERTRRTVVPPISAFDFPAKTKLVLAIMMAEGEAAPTVFPDTKDIAQSWKQIVCLDLGGIAEDHSDLMNSSLPCRRWSSRVADQSKVIRSA